MKRFFVVTLALVLSMSYSSTGQITNLITFEEPPITTPPPAVQVRYSNDGVVILNKAANIYAISQTKHPSKPVTPPNVLISRPWTSEFDNEPLFMKFTCGVEQVLLYTGVPYDPRGQSVVITLEAYDAYDQFIGRDARTFTNRTDIDIPLHVSEPTMQPIIRKIKLDVRHQGQHRVGSFEMVDNLTFKTEIKPPPQATEPPQVIISQPTASKTNYPNILISGTILGSGIFPEVNPPEVEISWINAPYSTLVSSSSYDLLLKKTLFETTPNKLFSFSYPYQLEFFGKNTIRVWASNAKGKVFDEKSITYFPIEIENEYTKNGGAPKYGSFVWGTTLDGCTFAVYKNGAIFNSSKGTFSSFGKIFKMWNGMATSSGMGVLGCAIGPEKSVKGGSYQDFVYGRIYSGSKGEYFVSEPFITAIDKLNFVNRFGLPVTDPSWQSSMSYILPIQWQKFETTVNGIAFTSTMEITEDSKTKKLSLWTATPDFDGAKKAGVKPTKRTPTVWRSYPCTKTGGKTSVSISKQAPKKKTPYSYLEKACSYTHYITNLSGTPEWVSMAASKIIPALGTVCSSELASEDTWETHSCTLCGIQTPGWCFEGVDWCLKIYPDADYRNLLGDDTATQGRTVGPFPQDKLEIEYEYCVVGYPPPKDQSDMSQGGLEGYFEFGDRLFVAGRWITDCGCHPSFGAAPIDWCKNRYKTEIHPPAAMVNMYTSQYLGKDATIGDLIYFDWWYSGEKVTVDIYPPPRPAPNALLAYSLPLWPTFCKSDGGKCGAVYVPMPNGAANHIQVVLSGRPDVNFNTPPKENSTNGQLYHGYVPPAGSQRYVPPPTHPHTKSLWGSIEVFWTVSP